MPDLARNVRSGEVCSAAELPVREELDDATFECVGCNVAMVPVATRREDDFVVVPHFRRRGQHEPGCRWEEQSEALEAARLGEANAPRDPPARMPRRLRLADHGPPRMDGDAGRDVIGQPRRRPRLHEGQAADVRRDAVAGSLHRIAECYLLFPGLHKTPLRIPGCRESTYAQCFERLRCPARGTYEQKAYFDTISFTAYGIDDGMDVIELPLGSSAWGRDARGRSIPTDRFRALVDMRDWPDGNRLGFLRDVRRAREQQMALHRGGVDERVFLFSIGEQDPVQQNVFHVRDGRLCCFLVGRAA